MNDAAATHKNLYRWERRTSALDQPAKEAKHGGSIDFLRSI